MHGGILLDPRTGKPETRLDRLDREDAVVRNERRMRELLASAPGHVLENLDLAREHAGPFEPRVSRQGWQELLYAPVAAGAAITAAAETIQFPDFTLPPNYMTIGKVLRYEIYFTTSTAITTPGTVTLRLRWGGVAGVVLAASGAWAHDPTAAATTVSGWVEYLVVCRTDGATGTFMCMGQTNMTDFDDATVATLKGNLDMMPIPVSAPAVATVDTTTAKALSPTYTQSVATGSSTAHIGLLTSLN